jgi:hypothetical protein
MDTACNGFLGMHHHPGFSAYAAAGLSATVGGFGPGSVNHHLPMVHDPFGSSSSSLRRGPGAATSGFFNGCWPTYGGGCGPTMSPSPPSTTINGLDTSPPRVHDFRSSPYNSSSNSSGAVPTSLLSGLHSAAGGQSPITSGSSPSSSLSLTKSIYNTDLHLPPPPSVPTPSSSSLMSGRQLQPFDSVPNGIHGAGSGGLDVHGSAVSAGSFCPPPPHSSSLPPPPPPPGLMTYGDMYQAAAAGARLFSAADLLQPAAVAVSGAAAAAAAGCLPSRLHEMYGAGSHSGSGSSASSLASGLYLGDTCIGSSSPNTGNVHGINQRVMTCTLRHFLFLFRSLRFNVFSSDNRPRRVKSGCKLRHG